MESLLLTGNDKVWGMAVEVNDHTSVEDKTTGGGNRHRTENPGYWDDYL